MRWTVEAPEGSVNGCNYRMLIQDYGIWHTFVSGENVIEFIPGKAGTVRYSCWMGMIHGNIYVVDNPVTTFAEKVSMETVAAPPSCSGVPTEYADESSCCGIPIGTSGEYEDYSISSGDLEIIYPDEFYEDIGMSCCE